VGKHFLNIWILVLACLMWFVWWKCNNCTFEDAVKQVDYFMLDWSWFVWWKYNNCTFEDAVKQVDYFMFDWSQI